MNALQQGQRVIDLFDPLEFIDQLKGGDVDKALEHVHPQAVWRIPGDPKYGGEMHHGHAGFRKFGELAIYFFTPWHQAPMVAGQSCAGHYHSRTTNSRQNLCRYNL